MKYNVESFKMKHLNLTCSLKPNYAKIMEQVFGYKNTFWDKHFLYRKKSKEMLTPFVEFCKIDLSKLGVDPNCKIKYPKNVDMLRFQCRLEIEQCRKDDIQEQIIDLIALACFEEHYKVNFNSDRSLFNSFREHIKEQPILHMVGLYNVLRKAIMDSNELWEMKFSRLQVVDVDYEQANGSTLMSQFNLLQLVKKLMKDFNCSYEEAFMLKYAIVQQNSLQQSAEGWLGQRMTQIKENKFKVQRESKR